MHGMIKTKFIPTAVVIVVAVVAFYVLFPSFRGTKDGPRNLVTMVVIFTPADRNECSEENQGITGRVLIQARVGSDNWPPERKCHSPWEATTYAAPGQVVEVRVEQYTGLDLTCSIVQLGYEPVTRHGYGPSRFACRWTVKP